MHPISPLPLLTRRALLSRAGGGLGPIALAWLLGAEQSRADEDLQAAIQDLDRQDYPRAIPALPHHVPRAKRVIFLTQSGGPSQLDLFDPKPGLADQAGEELPESVRQGQRLTTMTSGQERKPVTPSPYRFSRYGQAGLEFSELLPHTARLADDLCVIRSFYTDAINHDPAMTALLTGVPFSGHPSLGSWISYGLGNATEELPAFLCCFSGGAPGDQPLSARLWGSAFLPAQHQGVRFRGGSEPVLYLRNPAGLDEASRADMLETWKRLQATDLANPTLAATMDAFEMAFRMQTAVPKLVDLADEPATVLEMYGEEVRQPGTFASNCLLARRLIERGVRFVQLFHRGWDHHDRLTKRLPLKCQQTDRAAAALVADLKQRGLLDQTLVVWLGEFGRTVFSQGEHTPLDFGRDHHPRCFSGWLAGAGVKHGFTFGQTDAFSYNIERDPVHIHDLLATVLHLLGIDHERLTYRYQGRDHRLTDIGGRVVTGILS